MAYKQKINPRTGKFNLVSPGGEGGIKEVTSADDSIEVSELGDGVDLSVPLVTEQNHGRERQMDKLVRDHSFMNVISVDSSNSFQNGAEANASLMAADPEYYPVAGQMVEYINKTDGLLHVARYTGNFLIKRDGTDEYWCGATFDILNKVWLINRNVAGSAKLCVARSASGLFWQVTEYPASSLERRTMICSTSYASLIMSGNQSQEYDITYDGGDTLWQHLTVPKNRNYRSIKRAFIKIGGTVKEVFLFNENNSVYALDENRTFTELIRTTSSLLYYIGGHEVSTSIGMCDETEWFVDENEKNNVFILWREHTGNPDIPYNITWLREADTAYGWEEVTTYSVPTNYVHRLMTIHYEDGTIYAYSGERADNSSYNACSLNVGTDSITYNTRFPATTHLIPTPYGLVQVKGASKQVYIDGEEITMPEGATRGQIYTATYDGNKNILLVTGGTQYGAHYGNYGLILDVEKKRITNNNAWEEIALPTEEHEGIITVKEGKVKSAQLGKYLQYDKTTSRLSVMASDRATAYRNYLCKGTNTADGWCPIALEEIVDGTTKIYHDEECSVEWGTITNHAYNPNNPEDLAVTIDGVSHKFVHVADKIPETLATTKALLNLNPVGPVANDSRIRILQNGVEKGSFSLNQPTDETIDVGFGEETVFTANFLKKVLTCRMNKEVYLTSLFDPSPNMVKYNGLSDPGYNSRNWCGYGVACTANESSRIIIHNVNVDPWKGRKFIFSIAPGYEFAIASGTVTQSAGWQKSYPQQSDIEWNWHTSSDPVTVVLGDMISIMIKNTGGTSINWPYFYTTMWDLLTITEAEDSVKNFPRKLKDDRYVGYRVGILGDSILAGASTHAYKTACDVLVSDYGIIPVPRCIAGSCIAPTSDTFARDNVRFKNRIESNWQFTTQGYNGAEGGVNREKDPFLGVLIFGVNDVLMDKEKIEDNPFVRNTDSQTGCKEISIDTANLNPNGYVAALIELETIIKQGPGSVLNHIFFVGPYMCTWPGNFPMSTCGKNPNGDTGEDYIRVQRQLSMVKGWSYMDLLSSQLNTFLPGMSDDRLHPSQEGHQLLGDLLGQMLCGTILTQGHPIFYEKRTITVGNDSINILSEI